MKSFVFPPWTNRVRVLLGAGALGGLLYAVTIVWFGFSPKTTDAGYQPKQPVPYSHALHVGKLGLDCRYCHSTVEVAGHAAIPASETCMNCHKTIRAQSPLLQPVRDSVATNTPVPWVRVHDLPDYVYFNHSAHVTRGVGCVSCHGRVDKMEEVYQDKTLAMGFCLDCHRAPENHLRPQEMVTKLDWQPEDQLAMGQKIKAENHINPPTDCSTCHR
jgi:menaquinone reductase, multiheme cytochrome c subunit